MSEVTVDELYRIENFYNATGRIRRRLLDKGAVEKPITLDRRGFLQQYFTYDVVVKRGGGSFISQAKLRINETIGGYWATRFESGAVAQSGPLPKRFDGGGRYGVIDYAFYEQRIIGDIV